MSTRFASARSGISPVTLIIFILLAFIAGIIAFVMYTKKVKTEMELAKVRVQRDDATAAGFAATEQTNRLKDYLSDRKDPESLAQYFKDLDASMKWSAVAPRNFATVSRDLDLWILRLNLVVVDLKKRVDEATAAAAAQEVARDATRDAYSRREQEKKDELGRMDLFLKEEVAKREALVKQYDDEKKGLTDRFNNAHDDYESKKASFLRDTEKFSRRNAVIRRDLRVLRPEPSIHPPAGHVLRSDWQTNKVVVDLGERSGVFPGLVLEIYYFDKDGRRILKGKVEIMTVNEASSLCSVVENDVRNPIIAGDPVQTRFVPVRPGQKFVISGFISPDAPYDEEKLKAIIKLNGGEVQDTVGLSTDCLILGETAAHGVGGMDKKTAEMVPDRTRRGLEQAEVARELSVDIVGYEDFIQGLLH